MTRQLPLLQVYTAVSTSVLFVLTVSAFTGRHPGAG